MVSLDDMMGLTAHRSTLSDPDIRLLEALLRYNFMTAAQATRFWETPLRSMERWLKRLYQWGLVARGILPDETVGGSALVYALSERGFTVLKRLDHPLARDWAED